jgi:phosphate:Na+ symporter
VANLNLAIAEFVTQLHRVGAGDSARRLPIVLRLARYYETATELAVEASAATGEFADELPDPQTAAFAEAARALLTQAEPEAANISGLEAALAEMERAYQALKAHLLATGAVGQLPVTRMDARLRAASSLRRALEQTAKAARLLNEVKPD